MSVVFWHWIRLLFPTHIPEFQASVFRAVLSRHEFSALASLGVPVLLSMSPLRLIAGGYEAVILFFVLSGFVLSLPFWSPKHIRYLPFVIKRVFRIYFPYLTALVLAVCGNALLSTGGLPSFNEWFNTTWKLPISKGTLIGHITMLGAYDDSAFNTAFWSLIHEMRISLIFPWVMWLLRKIGNRGLILPMPLILLGCYLTKIVTYGRMGQSVEVLGLFVAGAYLAKFRHNIRDAYESIDRTARAVLIALSLLLYTFGWTWLFPAYLLKLSPYYQDAFISLGVMGIIAVAISSGWSRMVLNHRLPTAAGRISYSLYLIHGTVLFSLVYVLHDHVRLIWIFFAYIALSLLAARVLWASIENPSNKIGRHLAAKL